MRYIDEGLTQINLKLLSDWIERRESGVKFVDARRPADRQWWEAQQAISKWQKNPPPLEQKLIQDAYAAQLQQTNAYSSLAALGLCQPYISSNGLRR